MLASDDTEILLLMSMQLACRCDVHAVLKATPEHSMHCIYMLHVRHVHIACTGNNASHARC